MFVEELQRAGMAAPRMRLVEMSCALIEHMRGRQGDQWTCVDDEDLEVTGHVSGTSKRGPARDPLHVPRPAHAAAAGSLRRADARRRHKRRRRARGGARSPSWHPSNRPRGPVYLVRPSWAGLLLRSISRWSARGSPEYQFAGSPARVNLAVLRPQRDTSASMAKTSPARTEWLSPPLV